MSQKLCVSPGKRLIALTGLSAFLYMAHPAKAQEQPDHAGTPRISHVDNVCGPQGSTIPVAVPDWFARDIKDARTVKNNKTSWLPPEIKRGGLAGLGAVCRQKFMRLPEVAQALLDDWKSPAWYIALTPMKKSGEYDEQRYKIDQTLRQLAAMDRKPLPNVIADRAERLLLILGALQIPTPELLADLGCTAVMSRDVMAQLGIDFPKEFSQLNKKVFDSQWSPEFLNLLTKPQAAGLIEVREIPFNRLKDTDFTRGSLMFAGKEGGGHFMGWTASPWWPDNVIAVANGAEGIGLAQEYVGPHKQGDKPYNKHGPINGKENCDIADLARAKLIKGPGSKQYIDEKSLYLSNPRINIFACHAQEMPGVVFTFIDFRDPAYADVPLPAGLARPGRLRRNYAPQGLAH